MPRAGPEYNAEALQLEAGRNYTASANVPGLIARTVTKHVTPTSVRAHWSGPDGSQRAEYLLDHGMLDRVTPRTKLRDELITIIRMLLNLPPEIKGDLPPPADAAGSDVKAKKDPASSSEPQKA